jgi:YHS domain-containing protein
MIRPVIIVAIIVAISSIPALADTPADTTEKAAPNVVHLGTQTHCPVGGGEIDRSVFVDHQGQRVYFCCPGCDGAYVKDPEAHLAKIAAKGQTVASVQTTCPVSDRPIATDSFVEHVGRRVFFCCDDCKSTFVDAPQDHVSELN